MARNRPTNNDPAAEEPLVPEQVVRFLTVMAENSTNLHPGEWMRGFCLGLKALLGDVDTIGMEVDQANNLLIPEGRRLNNKLAQLMPASEVKPTEAIIVEWADGANRDFAIAALARTGHNIDECYPPPFYEFFYTSGEYLGSLTLLRSKSKSPISERTLQAMEMLKPFLVFVLSDAAMRRQISRPHDRLLMAVEFNICKDFDFWSTDRHVLTLRLLGYTHQQIADQLHISEHTVAKHIKKIYRVTGSSSMLELYWRYVRKMVGDIEEVEKARMTEERTVIVF